MDVACANDDSDGAGARGGLLGGGGVLAARGEDGARECDLVLDREGLEFFDKIDIGDWNIENCFNLGASRTPEQDPQFLIDELVEIGLRALSPGINDPFTAITALHWLGAATAELGARDLVKMDRNDDGDGDLAEIVFPLPDDFAHYLRRGFGAMRSAVATS